MLKRNNNKEEELVMFNPTIEQIGNLSTINKMLNKFYDEYSLEYDQEDEYDAQIKQMLDLIQEGYISIYEEMKRRI